MIDEGLLDTLRSDGLGVPEAQLGARAAAVGPDDPATIFNTSGTTGRPKGCVTTHANRLFVIRTLVAGT